MELLNQYHHESATFIARIFLGILFLFQGYDAVFKIKIRNVINTYQDTFSQKGIPFYMTAAAAWFTSCTEFIGGILLILGLFEYFALYLLALNLIIAAIGFGISSPVWDTKHVLPRLILLLLLLLTPPDWHSWSLDTLFFKP